MKKFNQKGFTLIEGLLIVIALSLVVGIGYYVYNSNKNTPQDDSSNTKPAAKETAKTTPAAKNYLEIKELGIKFQVTDKLKNTYYRVNEFGGVNLSVHELDKLKGFEGCVAGSDLGQDGIAAIDYAKVGDDHFGSPWTEADFKNVSQAMIGDTHYWIEPRSQAPCYDLNTVADDDPNLTLLGSFKKALVDQGSTITKL
jgi:hypothetical protein